MNQEEANLAINNTGTLLCLDVPQGTEFGIDCYSCEAGPLFKGIKLIPFGVHIIFFSVPNPHGGEGSSRMSFFAHFSPENKILVKQWNPKEDDFLKEEELDQDQIERLKIGVTNLDFDKGLGAYPYHLHEEWLTLSSQISPQTIKRIQPVSQQIKADSKPLNKDENAVFQQFIHQTPSSDNFHKLKEGIPMDEEDELAHYRANTTFDPTEEIPSTCNYIKFPKAIWNSSMSPERITKLNFDKSTMVRRIINTLGSETELLAELQFSFINFLIAQSYEGFEHWKKLVEVICRCQELTEDPSFAKFYSNFIFVLKFQIDLVPEDFFSDIIGGNNFLVQTLKEFFELQPESHLVKAFQKQIENRFGISFQIEDYEQYGNDDAPAIVEIEEMRALGLTDQEIQKILSSVEI